MAPFRDPATPLSEDQKLLRKQVLHQIETEPRSFYMGAWEKNWYGSERRFFCGTTRCLAGWALHLAGKDIRAAHADGTIEADGIRLLGLTRGEYGGHWDSPLFSESGARALARFREIAE